MSDTDVIAQPLTVTQLLDQAFKLSQRHFRALYAPVAVPVALASALIPLGQVAVLREVAGFETRGGPDWTRLLPAAGAFAALLFVALAVMIVGNSALMVGATHAAAGRDVPMAEAWKSMARPRAIGTLLLGFLVTGLGLLCCVVPGIYLMLAFCPLVAVMTEEGVFGRKALARCRELMRFSPGGGFVQHPRAKAFLVLFVGALLGYALSFLVQLPLIVVQQVIMLRGLTGGARPGSAEMVSLMAWINVPSQMLGMLVQTGVQLYTSFGLVLLYLDVRRQKEGGDLEAAIRSLSEPRDAR